MDHLSQDHDPHPLVRAVVDLRARVSDAIGASLIGLDPAEVRRLLVELSALGAQVSALELRAADYAHAVGVEEESGATSTGTWWAAATRQTRPSAIGKVALGRALETRWHLVREALQSGDILAEQSRVIARALGELPDDLDPGLVQLAEKTLVAEAGVHDAAALAKLGEHILTVIAPEIGEERDRRRLEKAERDAAAKRRFSMYADGHGSVRGSFTLPALHGAMLEKALHALAAPKHQASKGKDQSPSLSSAAQAAGFERSTPQKLGEAFAELIETLDPESLPKAGRINATVVARIDLADLMAGVGHATLDDGTIISVGEARRLACEAGLIPAVFDGPSEVLDVGRGQRFYTHGQRVYLDLRDGGCTAVGCDWPASMCHAHHDTPWSEGGTTDVEHGRLLCPRHHARAHDPGYEMRIGADNQVTFHRRT